MAKVRDYVSKEPRKWKTIVDEVCFSSSRQSRECAEVATFLGKRGIPITLVFCSYSTILFVLGWRLCNCSRYLEKVFGDSKIFSFNGMGH